MDGLSRLHFWGEGVPGEGPPLRTWSVKPDLHVLTFTFLLFFFLFILFFIFFLLCIMYSHFCLCCVFLLFLQYHEDVVLVHQIRLLPSDGWQIDRSTTRVNDT